MLYEIEVQPSAEEDLNKLPSGAAGTIAAEMFRLANDPLSKSQPSIYGPDIRVMKYDELYLDGCRYYFQVAFKIVGDKVLIISIGHNKVNYQG